MQAYLQSLRNQLAGSANNPDLLELIAAFEHWHQNNPRLSLEALLAAEAHCSDRSCFQCAALNNGRKLYYEIEAQMGGLLPANTSICTAAQRRQLLQPYLQIMNDAIQTAARLGQRQIDLPSVPANLQPLLVEMCTASHYRLEHGKLRW